MVGPQPSADGDSVQGPVLNRHRSTNKMQGMRPRLLSLRQALACDRLDDFVRQEETRGAELVTGSDLERALAPAHYTAQSKGSITARANGCTVTQGVKKSPRGVGAFPLRSSTRAPRTMGMPGGGKGRGACW
jgi:hypothetical protein